MVIDIVGWFNIILFAALFSIVFFEGLNWMVSKMSLLHAFYLNYKVDKWVKSKLPFYYETELHPITTSPSYKGGKRNYELYLEVRIKEKFRDLIKKGSRYSSTSGRIVVNYKGEVISQEVLNGDNMRWIEENIDKGILLKIKRDHNLKKILNG